MCLILVLLVLLLLDVFMLEVVHVGVFLVEHVAHLRDLLVVRVRAYLLLALRLIS